MLHKEVVKKLDLDQVFLSDDVLISLGLQVEVLLLFVFVLLVFFLFLGPLLKVGLFD